MKPMRPAKAWAVVQESGRLLSTGMDTPLLRTMRGETIPYTIARSNERSGCKPLRVRILDDAAVERAIAALKVKLERLRACALNAAGTPSYEQYSDQVSGVEDAIRDLGGKP